MVPGPRASASPENLSEMQILRLYSRPPGPDTLVPSLARTSPPGDSDAHSSVRGTSLGVSGVLQGGSKSLLEVSGHEFRVDSQCISSQPILIMHPPSSDSIKNGPITLFWLMRQEEKSAGKGFQ